MSKIKVASFFLLHGVYIKIVRAVF